MQVKINRRYYTACLKKLKHKFQLGPLFKEKVSRNWFVRSNTQSLYSDTQSFGFIASCGTPRLTLCRAHRDRASDRGTSSVRAGQLRKVLRTATNYWHAIGNRQSYALKYKRISSYPLRADVTSRALLFNLAVASFRRQPNVVVHRTVLLAKFQRIRRLRVLARTQRLELHKKYIRRRGTRQALICARVLARSLRRKIIRRKRNLQRRAKTATASGAFSTSFRAISCWSIFYRGRRRYQPQWVFKKLLARCISRLRLHRSVVSRVLLRSRRQGARSKASLQIRARCRAIKSSLWQTYSGRKRVAQQMGRRLKWFKRRQAKRGLRSRKQLPQFGALRALLNTRDFLGASVFSRRVPQRLRKLFRQRRSSKRAYTLRALQSRIRRKKVRGRRRFHTGTLSGISKRVQFVKKGVTSISRNQTSRGRQLVRRKRAAQRKLIARCYGAATKSKASLRAQLSFWRARRRDIRRSNRRCPIRRRSKRRYLMRRLRYKLRRTKRLRRIFRKYGPGYVFIKALLPWRLKRRRASYRRLFNRRFCTYSSASLIESLRIVPVEFLQLKNHLSPVKYRLRPVAVIILRRFTRYFGVPYTTYTGCTQRGRLLFTALRQQRMRRRYVARHTSKRVQSVAFRFFKRNVRRRVRTLMSYQQKILPSHSVPVHRNKLLGGAVTTSSRPLRWISPAGGSLRLRRNISAELRWTLKGFSEHQGRITNFRKSVAGTHVSYLHGAASLQTFRFRSCPKYLTRRGLAAQHVRLWRRYWARASVLRAWDLHAWQTRFSVRLIKRLRKLHSRDLHKQNRRGKLSRARFVRLKSNTRARYSAVRAISLYTVRNLRVLQQQQYYSAKWLADVSQDIISSTLKDWHL